jgi:hypothetical protein
MILALIMQITKKFMCWETSMPFAVLQISADNLQRTNKKDRNMNTAVLINMIILTIHLISGHFFLSSFLFRFGYVWKWF